MLVATDSAGEGIDLQDHCHRLVNFDIPFNPSRLEQRIGRIDRYGQQHTPEVFHFAAGRRLDDVRRGPGLHASASPRRSATVAARPRLGQPGHRRRDPGPLQPGRHRPQGPAVGRDDGNAIINRALAGGMELNRQLTELSRTYDDRKAEMHLTPGNPRRVVDTALALTAQPPLMRGRRRPHRR